MMEKNSKQLENTLIHNILWKMWMKKQESTKYSDD